MVLEILAVQFIGTNVDEKEDIITWWLWVTKYHKGKLSQMTVLSEEQICVSINKLNMYLKERLQSCHQ